jgi:hypothetical protein
MSAPRKPDLTPAQTDAIRAAETARAAADHDLTLAVARAKHSGASWAAIGATLGISRQGAWERFRLRIAEVPAELLEPAEVEA